MTKLLFINILFLLTRLESLTIPSSNAKGLMKICGVTTLSCKNENLKIIVESAYSDCVANRKQCESNLQNITRNVTLFYKDKCRCKRRCIVDLTELSSDSYNCTNPRLLLRHKCSSDNNPPECQVSNYSRSSTPAPTSSATPETAPTSASTPETASPQPYFDSLLWIGIGVVLGFVLLLIIVGVYIFKSYRRDHVTDVIDDQTATTKQTYVDETVLPLNYIAPKELVDNIIYDMEDAKYESEINSSSIPHPPGDNMTVNVIYESK